MKKIIKCMIIYSCVLSQGFSFELESKKRNTDKSNYIINPGAKIQEEKYQLNFNTSYTKDPLILKNNGQTTVLIKSIMTHELGFAYKLNNFIQLGLDTEYHQFESLQKESYLDSFMIDAKFNFFKNFAFNPYFIMGKDYITTINLKGQKNNLNVGNGSGQYGAKLIYDIPMKGNNFSLFLDLQKNMSEDKFQSIVNTYKYSVGISSTYNVSKDFKWKNEFYADYTDTSNPLSLLSYIRVEDKDYNIDLGVGSSDLFLSGANKYKVFAGIMIPFGGKGQVFEHSKKENIERTFEHSNGNDLIDGGIDEQKKDDEPLILEEPQSSLIAKISRSIASAKVEFKTLPNGKKAKIFYADHVTQMPTEIGIVYMTEKEYKEVVKKQNKELKGKKVAVKKTELKDGKKEVAIEPAPVMVIIEEPVKNEINSEFKNMEEVLDKKDEQKNDYITKKEVAEEKDPENILENVIDGVLLDVVKPQKIELTETPKEQNTNSDFSQKLEKEKALLNSLIMQKTQVKVKQEKDIKQKEIVKEIIILEEQKQQDEVLQEKDLSPEELREQRKQSIYKDFNTKKININSQNNPADRIVKVPVIKKNMKEKEDKIGQKIDNKDLENSDNNTIVKKVLNKSDESSGDEIYSQENSLNESGDMEEINEPQF